MVCVDKADDATKIVELIKAEFPLVPVLARASDRRHALDLIGAGADFHIRETFESSLVLGRKHWRPWERIFPRSPKSSRRFGSGREAGSSSNWSAVSIAGRPLFSGQIGAGWKWCRLVVRP